METQMTSKKSKETRSPFTGKKFNEEKRTTVKEIKNGYIITRSISWEDKDGRYHSDSEEIYSKDNPLEDMDKSLAETFKD